MSNDLRRPSNDPIRKSDFREQARRIVFTDRQRHKAKMVVDTAGMIARALERAYQYGFEDAQREGPTWIRTVAEGEDAVEWITIPSRAKREFESFARSAARREREPNGEIYYVPAVTERGTSGWSLYWPGKTPAISTLEQAKAAVAHQTMAILLRLGLVTLTDSEERRIVITDRGRNTWARFCESEASRSNF